MSEDNAVIKAIRDENKKLKSQLRDAEARADRALEKARREIAFDNSFESFGLPASVKDLVASELEDKEVSTETMQEAVAALGLDTIIAPTEPEAPVESPLAAEWASVSDLGSSVAAAAHDSLVQGGSIEDQINRAETPQEVAEIMRNAGQGT